MVGPFRQPNVLFGSPDRSHCLEHRQSAWRALALLCRLCGCSRHRWLASVHSLNGQPTAPSWRSRVFSPHSPCAVPLVWRLGGRCAGCGAAPPASRVAAQSLRDDLRSPLTPETSATPPGNDEGRQEPAFPARSAHPIATRELSRQNVA